MTKAPQTNVGLLWAGMALASALSALASSPSRGAPTDAEDRALIAKIEAHLKTLASGPEPVSCQLGPPPEESPQIWKAAMSGMSCQDLFSSSPPDWVVAEMVSNWFPVCSSGHYRVLQKTRPELSSTGLILKTEERTDNDLCASRGKEMRGAKGYVAPTQKELGVVPLRPGERDGIEARAQVAKRVEAAKARVAESCCGPSELECKRQMMALALKWCEPKVKPDVPDDCLANGTNFNSTSAAQDSILKLKDRMERKAREQGWNPNDWTHRASVAKQFPPQIEGRIELPAVRWADGVLAVGEETLLHELGHGCSYVRRSLALKDADPAALYSLTAWAYGKSCGNEGNDPKAFERDRLPYLSQIYSKLLSQAGASLATQTCYEQLVASGENLRFLPTEACAQSCPAQWYEELWAEWVSLQTLENEQLFPAMVPDRICRVVRDRTHPMGEEVLACAVRTPSFRKRLESLTACQ